MEKTIIWYYINYKNLALGVSTNWTFDRIGYNYVISAMLSVALKLP